MGSVKMHSTESRFVVRPSSILFPGVYVCIFQPGNFTGFGREVINMTFKQQPKSLQNVTGNLVANPNFSNDISSTTDVAAR